VDIEGIKYNISVYTSKEPNIQNRILSVNVGDKTSYDFTPPVSTSTVFH
jgi:hypothetical protein